MRRARYELEFDGGPGLRERLGQPDALRRRHEVVRGPVHQQDGRCAGASVVHRAGLPGQIGDRRGRGAEEQRLPGLRPGIGAAASLRHVVQQAGQVGDREPGDHALDLGTGPVCLGAGQRGHQREVAAGRVTP
jgi:hypothetical protein